VPVLDLAARYSEVGEAIMPVLNTATVAKYGIEFTSFILENVSVRRKSRRRSTSAVDGSGRKPE
jgi:hypothetical protein